MFDAMEIGRRISRLRKEKDMTQPALADKMGVSFQAVSNWERGASMPDIGKLPELAEILGVSVDELLGGGRGGELVKRVLDGSAEAFVEEANVTFEDAGEAAPVLKPKQVTRIVRAIEQKRERREKESGTGDGEKKFSVKSLAAIAPFLDEDYLDELAMRLEPETSIGELVSIAPFLSEKALDRLAERSTVRGANIGELASIAPFLSEDAIDKFALKALDQNVRVGQLASIAPFLSEKALGEIATRAMQSGGSISELAALAPFLEGKQLDSIVTDAIQAGKPIGEIAALFPFLSQKALRALVEAAIAGGDTGVLTKLGKFL
ncbi:MAG TPA: helix-turn-helix transcriptional regulator [Eubacteriales bacterium]|nr:helix-turn-helix transcriptional regulator [Eubacteriales bacterium]